MSVSKNLIKYIHSLAIKKVRSKENAFVVEGFKSVEDLLEAGFKPLIIIATKAWLLNTQGAAKEILDDIQKSTLKNQCETKVFLANDEELRRASLLQHPQQVIAVFELPAADWLPASTMPLTETIKSDLVLCLDGVQDPGNLGTIIRTADWFGIRHIVCSPSTADAFAPKVVQATMGSIARVKLTYTSLPDFLKELSVKIPIMGTLLDGTPLGSETKLPSAGVVVMGNEGNGISQEVKGLLTQRILIPNFFVDRTSRAESLNVSIATAIILAELRMHGK